MVLSDQSLACFAIQWIQNYLRSVLLVVEYLNLGISVPLPAIAALNLYDDRHVHSLQRPLNSIVAFVQCVLLQICYTLYIHFKMPVRLGFRTSPHAVARCVRGYSSDAAPIINVINIPAPNSGHIRILELNRPSARNAISKALLARLRAEVEDVQSQYSKEGNKISTSRFGGAAGANKVGPTRALVLASAVDASFCAGADLKERKGFTSEELVRRL